MLPRHLPLRTLSWQETTREMPELPETKLEEPPDQPVPLPTKNPKMHKDQSDGVLFRILWVPWSWRKK